MTQEQLRKKNGRVLVRKTLTQAAMLAKAWREPKQRGDKKETRQLDLPLYSLKLEGE